MIYDHIDHADQYNLASVDLQKGFKYLRETDFASLEPGTYEVDGKNIFAIVVEYETGDDASKRFEAHEKYLDIQYVVSGEERCYVDQTANFEIEEDQRPDKDMIFLQDRKADSVLLTPGMFAVLLPQDGHKPGCVGTSAGKVKKVVLKMALS